MDAVQLKMLRTSLSLSFLALFVFDFSRRSAQQAKLGLHLSCCPMQVLMVGFLAGDTPCQFCHRLQELSRRYGRSKLVNGVCIGSEAIWKGSDQ